MNTIEHIPYPWYWRVNESCKEVSLSGWKNGCRHLVMDFKRYGMQNAQPRFEYDGCMRDSIKYFSIIEGQEHNSSWNMTIRGNGNAELLALAPTAPHQCNNPKCPGNINRQKLELFDDMVKLLGSYTKYYCIDCSDRTECNERQSKCAEFTALQGIISYARGL